jgi:pilus assembly protein CpaF
MALEKNLLFQSSSLLGTLTHITPGAEKPSPETSEPEEPISEKPVPEKPLPERTFPDRTFPERTFKEKWLAESSLQEISTPEAARPETATPARSPAENPGPQSPPLPEKPTSGQSAAEDSSAEVPLKMSSPLLAAMEGAPKATALTGENARHTLKTAVHNALIRRIDLEKLTEIQADAVNGRQRLYASILQLVGEQSVRLTSADRESIAREVLDEIFGLGPLEPLLHDPTVNDILVNTFSTVYVERSGVIEKTDVVFKDNAHLMHIIDKIVSAVGRRIDESAPMVDARLLDGSRVNIVIPPLAVDGPLISIRRFGKKPLTSQDLLRFRALTPQMLEILMSAVKARLNIVISGGTGSGKTTLLNVLSGFISPHERIVTIEDSAELQIKQEHVARLETRPPNLEGKGAIRQRELVINALRMRPDRIILGEIRGEEAIDMLQAMNTGHDGSLTTIHSNTPRDAIGRIETMAMMGNLPLPDKAIRTQIASAIDLIIQVSRMADGSRRITHISEITGTVGEMVSLQDIFLFEKLGVSPTGKQRGRFYATGVVPAFTERLKASGIPVTTSMFEESVEV